MISLVILGDWFDKSSSGTPTIIGKRELVNVTQEPSSCSPLVVVKMLKVHY